MGEGMNESALFSIFLLACPPGGRCNFRFGYLKAPWILSQKTAGIVIHGIRYATVVIVGAVPQTLHAGFRFYSIQLTVQSTHLPMHRNGSFPLTGLTSNGVLQ
jgi:hypothetical protein